MKLLTRPLLTSLSALMFASLAATASAVPTVVEFYNPDLKHYFITADPGEQTFVDSGGVGNWQRTGYAFPASGASKVCRFFGNVLSNPATGAMFGPNSHFYTVDANECAGLVANFNPAAKSWKFESNDFSISAAPGGACGNGLLPVYRLYNKGFEQGVDSNHRFVINAGVYEQMKTQGWSGEGVAMCAPAEGSAVATVSGVTPLTLMYGKTSRFSVSGQNLDRGVTLVAPACANMAEEAGGTAAQRTFTCTPETTGTLPVSVLLGDGSTATAISAVVPLPQVTLNTTMGDIVVELYPKNTPVTVNNFLQYVADGFYKDKIFHRVISYFMIQGGGFDAAMRQGSTRDPIALEVQRGLSNTRGTIAMARTGVLDSATAQFFINVVDNISLDAASGGYAVFGKVVSGMDVVDKIKAVQTRFVSPYSDVPVVPVVITAATQTQ